MIKLGIVGMGWGKELHLSGFKKIEPIVISAICSTNKEKLEEIAANNSIPYIYTNWEQMISDNVIDALSIAMPNYLHYPIALAALDNNLHVLCEKPLALNLEQANEMYNHANQNQLTNMIAFPYRYVPGIVKLKERIPQHIGEIYHSSFSFFIKQNLKDNNLNWHHEKDKTNTDSLSNIGSHLIDLARYLVGEFSEVCGQMATFIKHRINYGGLDTLVVTDDVCNFIAKHTTGSLSIISASKVAHSQRANIEIKINGSNGSAICLVDVTSNGIIDSQIYLSNPKIRELEIVRDTKSISGINIYEQIGRVFYNGINSKIGIKPDFYDGLKVQEVIDAVIQSVESNSWVKIDSVAPEN